MKATPVVNDETLLVLGQELDAWLDRRHQPGGMSPGICLATRMLKVRTRAGTLQPLAANRVQTLYEEKRGLSNIVLKARQMGITTWIAGQFFLRTITHRGVLSVQVAHTREAAESIFAVVQRMWENLPDFYREGILHRSRANTGQMVFDRLDSEFRVVSAGEENAGRGLTIQNLHLSEVARWPGDPRSTLAGLRAALAPGGQLVLESTPAGACGAFYEEWQQSDEAGLVRPFFPWWLEPAYQDEPPLSLTAAETTLMATHGLSTRQIGFRRKVERSFRDRRAQEYAEDAETCFKASGECCFPVDSIDRRLALVANPVETRRSGALEIWLPPAPGADYILGVDSAGGGSAGDFASIQVIDRATGLQCAELRERLAPLELARAAAALAREYHHAEIAVERNNHGAAVLAYLDAVEDYRRLYAHADVAGWLTSAGNKPAMVSRIGALLEEQSNLFFSRRFLAECRSFVNRANGSTGAAPGSHDDCLMAMAVAHAVRAETRRRPPGTP